MKSSCDQANDGSCTNILNAWCLWDTGAQISMILSRMLSKKVKGGEEEGYASRCRFKNLLAEHFSLDLLEHQIASRLRLALGRIYRAVPISLF
jgi:hypothetical protein